MDQIDGETVRVSFESRAVCYIECIRKDENTGEVAYRSRASGFYWADVEQLYLITNRHNVTGLNPITGDPIGSFCPTFLRVWFNEHTGEKTGDCRYVKFVGRELSLFDKDERPTWFEHPSDPSVDVVAIRLDGYDWQERISVVNAKKAIPYSPMAGEDCFIVGYPEGLLGPGGTPIWKRASIATEPELDYDGRPVFLVDSLTRPGLSGAPVFARINGLWGQEGAQIEIGVGSPTPFGFWTNFLGIYAGREGDDKVGFQLARVWKKAVLDEIVSAKAIGKNPHD
ncbi:serine protease [Defluviimonas sp. WL0075]|uniref:Serine protease n=1 Tax=Albidovulum sediminicola TaxID=2984331 RepID=A0ABT2YXV0_9RHOB|nr:serine protease [Defluviimonas sp. WL0075]MCV2863341.1 serine protease [Defluviimonas sp. WL0075]